MQLVALLALSLPSLCLRRADSLSRLGNRGDPPTLTPDRSADLDNSFSLPWDRMPRVIANTTPGRARTNDSNSSWLANLTHSRSPTVGPITISSNPFPKKEATNSQLQVPVRPAGKQNKWHVRSLCWLYANVPLANAIATQTVSICAAVASHRDR